MDHPSPHMSPLLDAIAERSDCYAQVLYLHQLSPGRTWGDAKIGLAHRYLSLPGDTVSGRLANLAHAILRAKVDIWIINTIYTSPDTWLAAALLQCMQTPWIYMNEPLRPRGRLTVLKELSLRLLLRRAAGVVGMGAEAENRYRRLTNHTISTASVSYYADLKKFLAIPERTVPLDRPVNFFTAGQLVHRKGYDLLFAALTELPPTGWKLSIAGDGPLRGALESEFYSRWSADQVTFLGDVPFESRASAFEKADVFVFPSRWDGWGMAPIEALASGLPVIASDQVMSMREFLQDGRNGFTAKNEQPRDLSRAMRWFLENPMEIASMGRAARSSVSKYDPGQGARTLVEFISTIDAKQDASPAYQAARKFYRSPTWRSLNRRTNTSGSLVSHFRGFARNLALGVLAMKGAAPRGHRLLAYHIVLPSDRDSFSAHLDYLCEHFTLVTAETLIERRSVLGQKPMAAVTFDDGFKLLMGDALDVLDKYGVKATFFIPTGYVEAGSAVASFERYCRRAYRSHHALEPMSVSDLQLLVGLGHEIGSHSVSHPSMTAIPERCARTEISRSRERLLEWTGQAPRGFAYPYGDWNGGATDITCLLEQASYKYGVTMQRGAVLTETHNMMIPREHIEGNWPVHQIRYFLSR